MLPVIKTASNSVNLFNNAKKVVFGLLGAITVFFTGRYIVRRIRKNRALKQLQNSVEAQQAMLIRSALNPTGQSWLMWGDGTREQKLFSTASQIKDLNKVADTYKAIYNDDMIMDIQRELDNDEYTKFLNQINKQVDYSHNQAGVEDTKKNKIAVVQTTSLDVYGSISSFNMPFRSIKTLAYNQFPVGVTTGKIHTLSLFGSSLTSTWKALEIRVVTKEKTKKLIYVDAKSVKLINKDSHKNYQPIFLSDADF